MKYPELFITWSKFVFREEYPDPVMKGLSAEKREAVWLFIEENYINKYRMFVKIDVDYGSSGIWQNPFPGTRAAVINLHCETLELPPEVCKKLDEWQEYFDLNATPWEEIDPCDYELLDRWGLEVAKEVKRYAPTDVYIEYHQFRELVLQGDEVIELGVPTYIRDLLLEEA